MQTVVDFNTVLLDLAVNVASVCPSSFIGRNIKDIEKTLKKDIYCDKFINVFIGKVLIYKPEIDQGDEKFFLTKISKVKNNKNSDDFHKDLDGDESMLDKVFEFESIWHGLKQENKNLVIQYMQILCELAQNYFLANANY